MSKFNTTTDPSNQSRKRGKRVSQEEAAELIEALKANAVALNRLVIATLGLRQGSDSWEELQAPRDQASTAIAFATRAIGQAEGRSGEDVLAEIKSLTDQLAGD